MAKRASKKKLRDTKEDIISSLPDCMLLHILSFLPMRTCVMTSFLSRRWRHIWKDLQVINLVDYFKYFESQAVFVNSVFLLSKSFKYLRKLRLSCKYKREYYYKRECFCDDLSLGTWLTAVSGPESHLEELDFCFKPKMKEDDFPFEHPYFCGLPLSLFATTKLVKLSLLGSICLELKPLSQVRLSSLKTLTIKRMSMDTISMNVLLAGCPVLEDLDIHFFIDSCGEICVPSSLKRLKIKLAIDEIDDDFWAYLQINAPGLEYLKIVHMTLDLDLKMYNLQNVVEAYVDLYPLSHDNYTSTLLEFLHLLTGIKHLVLSLDTTQWLLSASGLNFPEYRHLRHLELNLPRFKSYLVFSLLEKCHVLQVLIIQNDRTSTVQSNLPKWVPKTNVSNCLESHLTSLHIKGFYGRKNEMRFARYILQKGLVLNTVIVANITSNSKKKRRILKKRLSNMPKASAMCRLQFD